MREAAYFNKENFKQAIYNIVVCIPPGRATSYGAIARAVGYPQLSRMVGHIMGECDSTQTGIPAHRVVNSQGKLTAKECFDPPGEMERLLASEGITVENDRIRNWKKVFWDPVVELR